MDDDIAGEASLVWGDAAGVGATLGVGAGLGVFSSSLRRFHILDVSFEDGSGEGACLETPTINHPPTCVCSSARFRSTLICVTSTRFRDNLTRPPGWDKVKDSM